MSIQQQIPLLEELSRIDEDIRKVDGGLTADRGGLQSLHDDLAGLTKRLSGDRESVQSIEKTRNELHLEARQMTSQIEKSREKLARSRNERETVAATRELEELRKLVRDREDEIERLSKISEKAKEGIADADAKRTAVEGQIAGSTEGAHQRVKVGEEERVALSARREALVKGITPLLYRRYESIRTRRPKAIAHTTDGTCSGCHIAVPPMMFQKMQRLEEFEQCPNCKRILYYVPKKSAEAEVEGDR